MLQYLPTVAASFLLKYRLQCTIVRTVEDGGKTIHLNECAESLDGSFEPIRKHVYLKLMEEETRLEREKAELEAARNVNNDSRNEYLL